MSHAIKEQIRPPVKWHGGKHYLAGRIIAAFPGHHTFVEPYGGAASVLLNKPPSPVEVYNDLDHRITRLFRVLRDHGDDLRQRLSLTPYSEVEFDDAESPNEDEVEQARRDFVRWRQSIGGRGGNFSYTLHRVRRGMADVVSGYLSCIDDELPRIVERLRTVQVLCRPALDVIRRYDGPETLFYCDPPYLPATRAGNGRASYKVDMTEQDHRALATSLRQVKGKVILSGYPSPLYDELYDGWRVAQFDIANHAASGESKKRQTECLWMNWAHEDQTECCEATTTMPPLLGDETTSLIGHPNGYVPGTPTPAVSKTDFRPQSANRCPEYQRANGNSGF
jgi:DNA adenine methylase